MTYYKRDLALIHHLGFASHADMCAPGILALLEPVRRRGGLVVELGCGGGELTRHLVAAGHRVLAIDASPAMVDLARRTVPTAEVALVTLPDDPVPDADAVVSTGHVLNYLPDEDAVARGLMAAATALKPGGVIAVDLLDLEYGRIRQGDPPVGWATDEWALVTEFSTPRPERFVRRIAAFVRNDDGSWRRDDEVHQNVLIDTSRVPASLAGLGVTARVGRSFGSEDLPAGMRALVGHRS